MISALVHCLDDTFNSACNFIPHIWNFMGFVFILAKQEIKQKIKLRWGVLLNIFSVSYRTNEISNHEIESIIHNFGVLKQRIITHLHLGNLGNTSATPKWNQLAITQVSLDQKIFKGVLIRCIWTLAPSYLSEAL